MPEDGRALADLTVLYTAANKRSTAYTLRVECVDEEALNALGITAPDPLHESDPDYAVGQQTNTTTTTTTTTTKTPKPSASPGTGDSAPTLAWILALCAALGVIAVYGKRKQISK